MGVAIDSSHPPSHLVPTPEDAPRFPGGWLASTRVVPKDELASLIDTICSNEKVGSMLDHLQGNDIQTFIDVIDTVCHHVLPSRRIG
jgi:hypothetical protein